MTYDELVNIGENWYQRTHKLREVWQNKEASEERRNKAFKLYTAMMQRTVTVANQISQAKLQAAQLKHSNYPSGGLSY